MLFLFRPFQLKGVKRKLFLVCFLTYCLDALYRVALQALGISHSNISNLQKIPLNAFFLSNGCLQVYLVANHFCTRSRRQKLTLFFQMLVPNGFCVFVSFFVVHLIYPAYNKQNNEGKLLIALFTPLIGVVFKPMSRICVQRLCITSSIQHILMCCCRRCILAQRLCFEFYKLISTSSRTVCLSLP